MNQPTWPFPTSQSYQEAEAFRQIFHDLRHKSKLCSPRGLKVLELEHHTYVLPPYARFCNFAARKLKLNYIKNEFLWYLRGDKFDTSIGKHGGMWKSLINADGAINSNYGQYIFANGQFDSALKHLMGDQDTRRASMVILESRHVEMDTKDVPCTYSLNFRIREGRLNMSVHMRSQDAIFGMGNDAPTFSFIHEMIFTVLRSIKYTELQLGTYYHTCDSLHVYERHFDMLDQLVNGDPHVQVDCPRMSDEYEIKQLRNLPFMYREVGSMPEVVWALRQSFEQGNKFTNWLYTEEA